MRRDMSGQRHVSPVVLAAMKVLCEASEDQLMDSVPSSVSRTGADSLRL